MKTGDMARLKQPQVQGKIVARRINPDTDELELQLQWADDSGEVHLRWFAQDDLEAA